DRLRERYDATGEEGDGKDDPQAEARNVVLNCWLAVLNALMTNGQDPAKHDLVALTRKALQEELQSQRKQAQDARKRQKVLEKVIGRAKRKGSADNPLNEAVRQQVKAMAGQAIKAEDGAATLEAA